MDAMVAKSPIKPLSLKSAPALIERLWPAQKISVETYKERDSKQSQTLTSLGSYWKGRKPLVLVRACVIASILPATNDPEKDLQVFEILCGIADSQITSRFKKPLTIDQIISYGTPAQRQVLIDNSDEDTPRLKKLTKAEKIQHMAEILARMPYSERIEHLFRPEEVDEDLLTGPHLDFVNEHLGTSANSLRELITQLGIMRFGHRPRVADTFCGGGSIPFEAARLGFDAFASDLNPIACMLTWGGFNVVGAPKERRDELRAAQAEIISAVERKLSALKLETDERGNRAKAFLYCAEVRCPQTGWMVPLAPSWVISKEWRVVAKLIPDHKLKRYNIEIVTGASASELAAAEAGTLADGKVIHVVDGQSYSMSIRAIRGDARDGRNTSNNLRRWERDDISPRQEDIFQERLYAILWMSKETLHKKRPQSFFAAVTKADEAREAEVLQIVTKNLGEWRERGLLPDSPIEPGEKTDEPIRTRGWTYWHHLFTPRQLHFFALLSEEIRQKSPAGLIDLARLLDRSAKINKWSSSNGSSGQPTNVFDNQALNTFFNYGAYASFNLLRLLADPKFYPIDSKTTVACQPASAIGEINDIYVTDPPYADAVNYHEITEFFIAWLRKNPPDLFRTWTWDSRRPLAIKGDGEDFRKNMIAAYRAMGEHMPENGLQIVMFTHQDAGVWGDMAQIFWGAGLQVMAAWYIATEITSELKKGGYVQGTVVLVLRRRGDGEHGYKDEIVQEVKVEVADQIDTMSGLNQSLKGHGRIENLFEDADLQMAGYAAALRVLTKYTTIDGIDMTKEAVRSRLKGERGLVGDIIEFAVQVANEHMVPDGMPSKVWEDLTGSERFFFKMLDVEETGAKKLDNYQNFARAFRVAKYDDLMGSTEPNKARLKSAKDFKKAGFEGSEFGASKTRALLFAIYETQRDVEGDEVLSHLRDLVPNYFDAREDLVALAEYIAKKRSRLDEPEARAAAIVQGLIRNERFG